MGDGDSDDCGVGGGLSSTSFVGPDLHAPRRVVDPKRRSHG